MKQLIKIDRNIIIIVAIIAGLMLAFYFGMQAQKEEGIFATKFESTSVKIQNTSKTDSDQYFVNVLAK